MYTMHRRYPLLRGRNDQRRARRRTGPARLIGRATGLLLCLVLLIACGGNGGTPASITLTATAGAVRPSAPATPQLPVASPTATSPLLTATPLPPTTTSLPTPQPSAVSPTTISPTATPGVLAQPGTVAVQIVDFAFTPETLTVPVGTTVVWTNTGVQHTTTSLDKLWGSLVMEQGDTFSFTFTQPGVYHYICGLHPDMEAMVIVR